MSYGRAPYSAAAFSELLVVSDGSIHVDSTQALPISGAVAIANAVAMDSARTLPLGGAVDLDDPIAFEEGTPERIPLGGSASATNAIAFAAPAPLPIGGSVALSNPAPASAAPSGGRNVPHGRFSFDGIDAPTLVESKSRPRRTGPRTGPPARGLAGRMAAQVPLPPRHVVGNVVASAPLAYRRGTFIDQSMSTSDAPRGEFSFASAEVPELFDDDAELAAVLMAAGLM